MPRPIVCARIDVEHHVVHEVREVEQDRVSGIACPVRIVPHQALIICVNRQIGARLTHVVFRRIPAEVESSEMFVDPFVQVVESPIEAVEIQVDQPAMA